MDTKAEANRMRLKQAGLALERVKKARDLAILDAHEAGLPLRMIARAAGLSKSGVAIIIAKKTT